MSRQPPNQALSTMVISNLVGGVSTRADALRKPTEVSEMINALPNWSEGLKRRPRTSKLIAVLDLDNVLDLSDGAFIHTYSRDQNEKYAVTLVNGNLSVISIADKTQAEIFGVTNIERAVTFPNGKGYLAAATPKTSFKAITIGDKTFIVNSEILPAILGATTSPADTFEALIWVRVGDYGTAYNVTIDGTTYGFTTSQTHREQIDTNNIAFVLMQQIPQGQNNSLITFSGVFISGDHITLTDTVSGKTNTLTMGPGADPDEPDPGKVTLNGVTRLCTGFFDVGIGTLVGTLGTPYYPLLAGDNTLLITGLVPGNFSFTCTTTSTNGKVSVTNAGTLPATYTCALDGSTIHVVRVDAADFTMVSADGLGAQAVEVVKGSIQLFEDLPEQAPDGFKVKITGDPTSALDDYYVTHTAGNWVETLKGGESTTLNAATMPHVLTRNSDGTFTFDVAPWLTRLVGDITSNPFPSLIGQPIKDVFFYKSRLGYVAGINMVMAQATDPFNLFRQTVTQLLDEDVIDVFLTIEKTASIDYVTPTATDLLLWTDLGQASVAGDQLLTPKTVNALPDSNYVTSPRVRPVRLGNNMYFAVDRKTTTGVFEYQTVLQNGIKIGRQADDITDTTASYIKGLSTLLLSSDSGQTLVMMTTLDNMTLYVATMIGVGQDAYFAWHKWTVDATVITADILENKLVLLVIRGGVYQYETLIIEPAATDPGLDFQIHLDGYVEFTSGTYTA